MTDQLNAPVLTLNSNWQPCTFLPVKVVICTLLRDMACVIHPETYEPLTFEQWMERAPVDSRFIKTSGRPVAIPDVIVLKKYGARPPMKIGFNRQNLFKRDDHECQYCGIMLPGSKLQVEHVLPRSRGGETSWINTVAACNSCNSHKANRTPKEAGMHLRKMPKVPTWKPGLKVPNGAIRPIWLQFMKQGA